MTRASAIAVTFANQPRYRKLARRLSQWCQEIRLPLTVFTESFLRRATPYHGHANSPYSFKIHALEVVAAKANVIVWLDTSVLLLPRGLQKLWRIVQQDGYLVHVAAQWPLADWVSDDCLEVFDVSRDDLADLPICYSGFVAFDLTRSNGRDIFARWAQSERRGGFIGPWSVAYRGWNGHRHDQSCLSLVLRELGLTPHHCLSVLEEPGVLRKCDVLIDRRGCHALSDIVQLC